MRKKMLDSTTIVSITASSPNGSGLRRVGEDTLREGWIDRQFRLTADLLHLRMRLEALRGTSGFAPEWAPALVERLELFKDAMYEISADALAPPMAPLLTPSTLFLHEAWAIYTWGDDVVALLVARLRSEAPPEPCAALPTMNRMAMAIAELERVLGAEHWLLPRARDHVAEAYMLALGIEAELANAYVRVTKSNMVPKRGD